MVRRVADRWIVAAFVCCGVVSMTLSGAQAQTAEQADRAQRPAEEPVQAPPARRPHGRTLEQCLALAEQNFPRIAEARAKTAYYRAQLDEARFAPFSQWSLTAGVALAPTVRGGPVYSPNTDVSLTSNMGLAWRATIDGFVPLWTFGKITNLVDAAEAQVKLGHHQVAKERNQVRLDVRKAYFGLQLARTSLDLLDEASSKLDDEIKKLTTQVDEGDADEIDLFKIQMFRAELEAREAEAQRYETIALAGLKFLTGVEGRFDIASDQLVLAQHQLGPVERYLHAAATHRPEINMARAGIEARTAQLALARSRYYPDIGVGLSAGWTRAPEVADQINPYVRDDANYLRYGAALGARWNLDFLPAMARVEQAQAQLDETIALQRLAKGGAATEVRTAYAEVVDAKRREEAFGKAESYAKKWMIAVQQGTDLGLQESNDMVEPAKQYALQRFNHLNAMMDYNVAMSKLALVTGWNAVAPGGR